MIGDLAHCLGSDVNVVHQWDEGLNLPAVLLDLHHQLNWSHVDVLHVSFRYGLSSQILVDVLVFNRMASQVLVESMDLSAHRLSVKTSVEDESEAADGTLSRWDLVNISVDVLRMNRLWCAHAVSPAVSPYVMTHHQNYSEWPRRIPPDSPHRTHSGVEELSLGDVSSLHTQWTQNIPIMFINCDQILQYWFPCESSPHGVVQKKRCDYRWQMFVGVESKLECHAVCTWGFMKALEL